MNKITALFFKILDWLRMNGATIFGLIQAAVKALKEIVTGLINLLSIFTFTNAAEAFVIKVRGWIDILDEWLEKAKAWLLTNIA